MQAKQGRFWVTTLTFILGALLYILFLVLLRYDLKPNFVLFWIGTILMVADITYQIFKHPGSEKFILFEILLLTLLIHLVTVIPLRGGVFGDDFPQYFFTTKAVMELGFPPPASALNHPPYSELLSRWMIPGLAMYPVMIMNAGVSSLVTGVDLFSITRWLPSFWSSIAILVIYIFSMSLYGNKRAALLAALGFSTYITYVEFHSQYTREGIAFTMLLFAIYAFYAVYQKNRHSLISLAILFVITLVLAHYYVSIMWIIILIVMVVCFELIYHLAKDVQFFSFMSTNRTSPWNFVALVVATAFSHWLYMEVRVLPSIVNQMATPVIRYGAPTFPSPVAQTLLKGELVSWGTWLFTASFAAIIIIEIIKGLKGKSSKLKEDFTLAALAATLLIIHSVLLANITLHPGRLPVFIYPFMLIVVAQAIMNINKPRLKQILTGIVILFVVFNLFRVSFVPVNPLKPTELTRIISTQEGKAVDTRYWAQQDPQGIEAASFYRDTGNAKFIKTFIIGDEKVMAEAIEPWRAKEIAGEPGSSEQRSMFPGLEPYTRLYIVVSPNSYLEKNRVYDNGKVEIIK